VTVDDISVDSGIVGEREKLDSGAGIGGAGVQSDGNHAVFGGKDHEKVREKGKSRGLRAKSRRLIVV
jgi:hypothetical protein